RVGVVDGEGHARAGRGGGIPGEVGRGRGGHGDAESAIAVDLGERYGARQARARDIDGRVGIAGGVQRDVARGERGGVEVRIRIREGVGDWAGLRGRGRRRTDGKRRRGAIEGDGARIGGA